MQPVEEFMRDLFSEQTAEEKRILANRARYRQKFFDADCRWDNRENKLELIESDKITSIETSEAGAVVITEVNPS